MNKENQPILCRAAVQLAPTATGEMMYMPGGVQSITPMDGGIGQPIRVLVDAAGAAALNAQCTALRARNKRPFFDFNHEDGPASFWPEEFYYAEAPAPGIYCRGEWSASGRASVEGKEWRQFSPVFHVDNKRGNPARIVCREAAKPNMGGLVNDPAFHQILPLWAKDADGAQTITTNEEQEQSMTNEQLAALQAKNTGLQQEIDALKGQQVALKAKNENDAVVAAQIAAKEAEMRAAVAQVELEQLRATSQQQAEAIAARNRADAEACVRRAVERGAIAAKDSKAQEALVAKGAEDPAFLAVIDAMQGQALSGRMTPSGSGVQVAAEAPNATLKAYASLVCRNAEVRLSSETAKEKGQLAREAAAIFARDIERNDVLGGITMEEAIKAADVSDAQVGLLAGTLVLQRALPLLQYEYPLLSAVTSDYSDSPGLFGQTESTRIILKPAVQTYNPATDAAGRPLGWNTASRAQSVDVSVTLDEHVGVPIVFGVQTLSKTIRNLFGETAPQALYALGGYAVNKLTSLMTAANFNAYAANSVGTGATTSGSTTVTVASTAGMYPGQEISGTGIPANTYVRSVTDGTTAVLTQAATATGSGLTFTLGGGRVPQTYATYAKAVANFTMADLGSLKAAFDTNEVPGQDRFALLNAAYHSKLAQDPNFNTFFAAMRKPEVITDGSLPKLQGFNPLEAPWFPSSSNRVGFAGHRSSLILKSRLPQDFSSAVGGSVPGSVTTVTAPGGISVLLVQYVSLRENYAEWRPEVMLGAAVGDRRSGLVVTSA
jgi:hypothetical protein